MKNKKLQISWIIYPATKEHKSPAGFEGIIPPIGTRLMIDQGELKRTHYVHEHVMYYDDKGNAIYSIRAREAFPYENTFQPFEYKINR